MNSPSGNGNADVRPSAASENNIESAQGSATASAPQAAPRRPWREVFKVHPAADLFPLMSADELRELADDIEENGLQSPVVMYVDGDDQEWVLDGRNRLDAMALVGVDVCQIDHVHQRHVPDPFAYVVSANIHRRHLTF